MLLMRNYITGRAALLLSSIVILASAAEVCRAGVLYTGVSLAGAEFGISSSRPLPGEFGVDYTYPTSAEINYFVSKGMNTFRLPFRWERLQHEQFAEFDYSELSRLDAFVNYATGRGAHVILDPHNYARYYPIANNYQSSAKGTIGGPEGIGVPNAAFADLWSRLATRYKDNDRVIFGLMNEPNSMSTEQWVSAANDAIATIRTAGAENLILVPGNGWTGGWTWNQNWYGTPNATAMLNIVDPNDNYAYEVHQYLDHDGSGSSSQIGANTNPNNTNIGVERLASFTQWLKTHDKRAFLGEFAVANSRIGSGSNSDGPQIGDEALANMLNYLNDNNDVWLGWSWWAAGPRWDNYLFSLEPTNLGQQDQVDRPAMAVLQPFFAPLLPGDFNDDGRVDAADYTRWRDSLGGAYSVSDYNNWKDNFGKSAPGAGTVAAAPEPSAMVLFILGCVAFEWSRFHCRVRVRRI